MGGVRLVCAQAFMQASKQRQAGGLRRPLQPDKLRDRFLTSGLLQTGRVVGRDGHST